MPTVLSGSVGATRSWRTTSTTSTGPKATRSRRRAASRSSSTRAPNHHGQGIGPSPEPGVTRDSIYISLRYNPGERGLPGVVTGTGLRRGSVPGPMPAQWLVGAPGGAVGHRPTDASYLARWRCLEKRTFGERPRDERASTTRGRSRLRRNWPPRSSSLAPCGPMPRVAAPQQPGRILLAGDERLLRR